MTRYVVGFGTNKGWNLVTKSKYGPDEHYEFESIVLARKWARQQINESRFSNLSIFRKSAKGEYTYCGKIQFADSSMRYIPRWNFVWISKDGTLSILNRDGTLKKA